MMAAHGRQLCPFPFLTPSVHPACVPLQFEAEVYDLTSSLTPVQSRLEALRQKGMLI